jgi:hypothetical protein
VSVISGGRERNLTVHHSLDDLFESSSSEEENTTNNMEWDDVQLQDVDNSNDHFGLMEEEERKAQAGIRLSLTRTILTRTTVCSETFFLKRSRFLDGLCPDFCLIGLGWKEK